MKGHFENPKASSESPTKARSWTQPQTGPAGRDPGYGDSALVCLFETWTRVFQVAQW